ncbi:MAG: N-acetylmuramoyl-L-alanine amidase, partial [Sphingomonas sp.]
MFALLAMMAGWVTAMPAWASTVQSVAMRGGRIVIRFDDAVRDATSRVMSDDGRIVVDVTGATPGAPLAATGLVTRITQQRHGSG